MEPKPQTTKQNRKLTLPHPPIDNRTVHKETFGYYTLIIYHHLHRNGAPSGLYGGIARPNTQPYTKHTLPATGPGQPKKTVQEALEATKKHAEKAVATAEHVQKAAEPHPNPLT